MKHSGALILAAGLVVALTGCRGRSTVYDLAEMQDWSQLIVPTRHIDFGTAEGRPRLVASWSGDEKEPSGRTFTWALSRSASVSFDVTEPRDTLASFTCRPFPRAGSTQTIQVKLNGQALSGKTIDLTPEFRSYQMLLPARLLQFGANRLTFDFAYSADVPAKGPQPADTRQLAVCFDELTLTPFERGLPEPAATPPGRSDAGQRPAEGGVVQPAGSARAYLLAFPAADRQPRLEFDLSIPDASRGGRGRFTVVMEQDGKAPETLYERELAAGDDGRGRVDLKRWGGEIGRLTLRLSGTAPEGCWTRPLITARKEPERKEDPRVATARESLSKANILIILLDAATPSHFGVHGYHLDTTPNIDRIAREGVLFTNAYCNAVYTQASTGSLMTGTYPDIHRVLFPSDRLPETAHTIPEMLVSRGFRTAAFIGNSQAGTLRGYEQGFQTHHELFRYEEYDRKCANQNIWLFPWLEANRKERFFLYLHFREPHFGGPPPQEFLDKFSTGYTGTIDVNDDRERINRGEMKMTEADLKHIVSYYDALLNFADYEVGLIEKKMKDLGLWDNTLVFIMADHGEALWEHGYFGHNVQVYQNMAWIPLIIRPPAGASIPGGRKVDSVVQTVDLFATLADLHGSAQAKEQADGRSILELLAVPGSTRPGFAYTRTLWQKPTYAIRDGRWEYVYSYRFGEQELFDTVADPKERNNLIQSHPILASYLHQNLVKWIQLQRARARGAGVPEAARMDEETRQNLISLGYIDAKTGEQRVDQDSR